MQLRPRVREDSRDRDRADRWLRADSRDRASARVARDNCPSQAR